MLAVVNNSNSWFKVVVNGREGYVSGEYLTGTLTSDFNLGTGHIVCDTTVNLREQPNTSSSVLASLSNSTAVSVTGVYQGWYKVSCNGKNGYVHPDYITFAAVQTPAPAENKAPVTPDSNVVSYTGTSEARAGFWNTQPSSSGRPMFTAEVLPAVLTAPALPPMYLTIR